MSTTTYISTFRLKKKSVLSGAMDQTALETLDYRICRYIIRIYSQYMQILTPCPKILAEPRFFDRGFKFA